MKAFTFKTVTSIQSETGCSDNLASVCAARGARSVLVVTDPGIRLLGLIDTALSSFSSTACSVAVYDQVYADPPESNVLDAAALARDVEADLIVGFGGGSSMDVAKVVSLLAHPGCRQSLAELYGVDQVLGPRLPLIQIPTTAGTGSEVTNVAVITTGATTKMGVASPILLADLVLLDAALTVGLPPAVTAATGIDAIVHAIEAFTSKIRKNPVSDMLALRALELLGANIRRAVQQGQDREARTTMLLGAMFAGQAFANAPVAGVHALAYPIGGHFHVPHGLSNSLVLPQVLAFNAPHAHESYAQLAAHLPGLASLSGTTAERCDRFIEALIEMIRDIGLPNRLQDVGIPESALPRLAADAMLQQRLLVNNPREIGESDALAIYNAVY